MPNVVDRLSLPRQKKTIQTVKEKGIGENDMKRESMMVEVEFKKQDNVICAGIEIAVKHDILGHSDIEGTIDCIAEEVELNIGSAIRSVFMQQARSAFLKSIDCSVPNVKVEDDLDDYTEDIEDPAETLFMGDAEPDIYSQTKQVLFNLNEHLGELITESKTDTEEEWEEVDEMTQCQKLIKRLLESCNDLPDCMIEMDKNDV